MTDRPASRDRRSSDCAPGHERSTRRTRPPDERHRDTGRAERDLEQCESDDQSPVRPEHPEQVGVSVVVPTYNEAANVVPLVERCLVALEEYAAEVVVVDDDSPDGTGDRVERSFADSRPVRTIRRTGERGLATAVLDGVRGATYDYAAVLDADFQHPPRVLPELVRELEAGADVAVGTRRVGCGSDEGLSPLRRVVSRGASALAKAAVPSTRPLSDPTSGLFAVDCRQVPLAALSPSGFKFLPNVLARSDGLDVAEVPYTFRQRTNGESSLSARDVTTFLAESARLAVVDRVGEPSAVDGGCDTSDTATAGGSAARGVGPAAGPGGADLAEDVAVVTSYPPVRGNAGEYARHVVDALADQPGTDVTVFAPVRSPADDGEPSTAAVADLPGNVVRQWARDSPSTLWRLLHTLRSDDFDAVHFNLSMTTFGSSNVARFLGLALPALARALTDARVVTTLHETLEMVDAQHIDEDVGIVERFGATVATQLLLLGHEVTVTAREFGETLERRYVGDVRHVPHGTFDVPDPAAGSPDAKAGGGPGSEPVSGAPPAAERAVDRPYVLAFGYLAPHKDYETLFDAAEQVRAAGRSVDVVVAGGGHPDAPGHEARVRSAGADAEHVTFTGYVPEAEVAPLFEDALAVVLPYRTCTGVSGVFHRARAHDCPAIVYDTPSMRTATVEQGGAAALVEPGAPDELAAAIARLLDDPDYHHRLARHRSRDDAGGGDLRRAHTIADVAWMLRALCSGEDPGRVLRDRRSWNGRSRLDGSPAGRAAAGDGRSTREGIAVPDGGHDGDAPEPSNRDSGPEPSNWDSSSEPSNRDGGSARSILGGGPPDSSGAPEGGERR